MGNSENPGVLNFGIKQYINEQYTKVKKDPTREYLTLSEILEVQAHEDYPFDFRHLAILFVCDNDKDGKFSMQDLEHFALWIQLNLVFVQMYEFKSQLQGRTTEKLIETLQKKDKQLNAISSNPKSKQKQRDRSHSQSKRKNINRKVSVPSVDVKVHGNGEQIVIQWVLLSEICSQFLSLLISDCLNVKSIKGVTYLKIECVKLIYEVFNVKVMTEMDIQSFFYLVKSSSEELGYPIQEIYDKHEEEDEEYIVVCVCRQLIQHFIKGVVKTLTEIGYTESI